MIIYSLLKWLHGRLMPLKGFLMLCFTKLLMNFRYSSTVSVGTEQKQMWCSTKRRLNTISLLDYRLWLPFTISLHAKFYKCFRVVQKIINSGNFFKSIDFFSQIEMVKRIDKKTQIESIDRDISVIFDFRNLFKNIDCWI